MNLGDASSATSALLPPSLDRTEEEEEEDYVELSRGASETSLNSNSNTSWVHAYLRQRFQPHHDTTTTTKSILTGLLCVATVGIFLGLVLPKNSHLHGSVYPTVSNMIGYTYFVAWSISFYPQIISNLQRRSTSGLSVDFCWLNVVGFACYSIYNGAFFFSKAIQHQYQERHDGGGTMATTVQSNDVAFALHACLLSSVTLWQILYYGGRAALRPSPAVRWILCGIGSLCGIACAGVAGGWMRIEWLDVLYLLSFIKIGITLIKYIPQALLNYKNKSTVGWSIWNILLDLTGGCLSDLQLVLDCANGRNFHAITGNLAKLGLGAVSILFDVLFILQHYVLYPHNAPGPTMREDGYAGIVSASSVPDDGEEELTDDAVRHTV